MSMWEQLPVKVTVTVEVDDHVLTFARRGRAAGSRFHGQNPRALRYASEPEDTLEAGIRRVVADLTGGAWSQAQVFLRRAYPVHTDDDVDVEEEAAS